MFFSFQWAPTLGGECYARGRAPSRAGGVQFQWAPTLGGECYASLPRARTCAPYARFNGHPPLGVNATYEVRRNLALSRSFNGHPPLGVNATQAKVLDLLLSLRGFNGHPPLGVNATAVLASRVRAAPSEVSMGTHPWG